MSKPGGNISKGFSSIVGTRYQSTAFRRRGTGNSAGFKVLSSTEIKSLNVNQLATHIDAAKKAVFLRNPEAQNKDIFRAYIDALIEERNKRT